MEWQDEGLILGTRKHGENGVILELMTKGHGRHLGIVRGGRSSRHRPVLQPGNKVTVTWRARLEEHLGAYLVEPTLLRAAELMGSQRGVYGVQMLGCHLRLLAEREPHDGLYQAANIILDHIEEPEILARLMVIFELALLNELGFGLDLKQCADTGTTRDLVYVSPKTGRAVCKSSGEPWHDRLLRLPSFVAARQEHIEEYNLNRLETEGCSKTDMKDAFNLTGFFLDRHVYGPRNILQPNERSGFIKTILKTIAE